MVHARGPKTAGEMLHYKGLVEFGALGSAAQQAVPADGEEGWKRLRLPGLELDWHADFADVSMRNGVLALASGRARDATSTSLLGEADRWLERYAERDLSAADRVGGAFAVVVVDFLQCRIVLFVDRFSIEPLCYAKRAGSIGFANTACDVPGVHPRIDPQSLYDYLYFHVIPAPQTAFRGVCRMPPAHRVLATATGTDLEAYWEPVFLEDDRHDLRRRLRQFADLVEQSVREEADDPKTACFLSGGTDSSTVAGMLTRLRGEQVDAYSIGFEAEGYDEMAYARIAASHFGLRHHQYYVTPDDLVEAIPRVAGSLDQPFGNSSIVPAYLCATRAREDGFTRMLAGDGGDELFAGNSRYATQAMFEPYHRLPRGLRAMLEGPASDWKLFRSVPGFRQLGGYVRHARVPMPDRLHTFNLLQRLDDEGVFDPAFRASFDPQRPLAQQRETWHALTARTLVNRMLAYDWKFTLADNDLPKVRTAAQLAGITVGFPLLGRELTDFSLSIPPSWKLKGFRLRWFFKEALRGFLPAEILRKRKHGFGLPFGPWLLRHAGLRRLAEDSLEGIAGRGIVSRGFTGELIARRLPEAPGYYGEMVWILMMLEQWMLAHDAR